MREFIDIMEGYNDPERTKSEEFVFAASGLIDCVFRNEVRCELSPNSDSMVEIEDLDGSHAPDLLSALCHLADHLGIALRAARTLPISLVSRFGFNNGVRNPGIAESRSPIQLNSENFPLGSNMRKYLDIISGADLDSTPAVVETTGRLHQYLATLEEGYSSKAINGVDVHEFIRGYIEAILFTETDESNESGGEPLNQNYGEEDFSHEAMERVEADCRSFLHKAAPWITEENYKGALTGTVEAHAGHDFWLTRVGHGAGFWDGDWKSDEHSVGDGPLTQRAKEAGHVDVILGDDGKLHFV